MTMQFLWARYSFSGSLDSMDKKKLVLSWLRSATTFCRGSVRPMRRSERSGDSTPFLACVCSFGIGSWSKLLGVLQRESRCNLNHNMRYRKVCSSHLRTIPMRCSWCLKPCQGLESALHTMGLIGKNNTKVHTSTLQPPFKILHMPLNKCHTALNRAVLWGVGRRDPT